MVRVIRVIEFNWLFGLSKQSQMRIAILYDSPIRIKGVCYCSLGRKSKL